MRFKCESTLGRNGMNQKYCNKKDTTKRILKKKIIYKNRSPIKSYKYDFQTWKYYYHRTEDNWNKSPKATLPLTCGKHDLESLFPNAFFLAWWIPLIQTKSHFVNIAPSITPQVATNTKVFAESAFWFSYILFAIDVPDDNGLTYFKPHALTESLWLSIRSMGPI
jgi:hypothetical protein